MKRRSFLLGSLAIMGASGCRQPQAFLNLTLRKLQASDGFLLSEANLSIPDGHWKALRSPLSWSASGPLEAPGFLFVSAKGLLAVDVGQGKLHNLEGPDDGLWVAANFLVTGEKLDGDSYRVRAHRLPDTTPLWQVDFPYCTILGHNQSHLYLAHQEGVVCLELSSGRKVWENPQLVDLKSSFVSQRWLLLGVGIAGRLAWVDLKQGKILRELVTHPHFRNIVTADNDRLSFTLTRRYGLLAFGSDSDKPRWRFPISSESHESRLLTMDAQTLVLELDDQIQAFDLAAGTLAWKAPPSVLAVQAAQVAVLQRARAQDNKWLVAWEARSLKSGQVIWQTSSDWSGSWALAAGGHIYLIGQNFPPAQKT